MKRIAAFCLTVILVCGMVFDAALAAGQSGNVYGGPSYENVELSPGRGISLAQSEGISWRCSGSMFNKGLMSIFGWIGQLGDLSICTISEIYLELYELENKTSFSGTTTVEKYHSTLFKNEYDHVTSADFSQSGVMRLSSGQYRFKLKVKYGVTDSVVCTTDFSVYDDTPPPVYAVVDVIYKLEDGTVFLTDKKTLYSGENTVYCEYADEQVTLISSPTCQVYVNSYGNSDVSEVEFVFRWNRNGNQTTDPITPPGQSSSAKGTLEQSMTESLFWHYYPDYEPFAGHEYASSGQLNDMRMGQYLFSAGGSTYEIAYRTQLYSEADANSTPVLSLSAGDTIYVNGIYTVTKNGQSQHWLLVWELEEDRFGWVRTEDVSGFGSSGNTSTSEPSYSQPFPIGRTCVIHASREYGYARTGPGLKEDGYDTCETLYNGEEYIIIDYTLGTTGKDWYLIDTGEELGWVSSGIAWVDGYIQGTINGVPIED